jgi:adenosylmethionine-8-amino-7-oxononanoate aminotransferase
VVAEAGGPDKILGFVYEIVQERTGHVLPADFTPALEALRAELDLPLIAVETTTAFYRSGHGAFASGRIAPRPDVLTWWGGGQSGYLHTSARWLVATALTLVSTWDGDELSLVRNHHQLRAARRVDVAAASRTLDELGLTTGLGLYRVIDAGERAAAVRAKLAERGVLVRAFPGGRLGVIPALDDGARLAGLGPLLREVLA